MDHCVFIQWISSQGGERPISCLDSVCWLCHGKRDLILNKPPNGLMAIENEEHAKKTGRQISNKEKTKEMAAGSNAFLNIWEIKIDRISIIVRLNRLKSGKYEYKCNRIPGHYEQNTIEGLSPGTETENIYIWMHRKAIIVWAWMVRRLTDASGSVSHTPCCLRWWWEILCSTGQLNQNQELYVSYYSRFSLIQLSYPAKKEQ